MKEFVVLLMHLLTVVGRLLGAGGTKALVAENLLIKQQFMVLTRSRVRAPNLFPRDRILLGFWSLFIRRTRFRKVVVTSFAFHDDEQPDRANNRNVGLAPCEVAEALTAEVVHMEKLRVRHRCRGPSQFPITA